MATRPIQQNSGRRGLRMSLSMDFNLSVIVMVRKSCLFQEFGCVNVRPHGGDCKRWLSAHGPPAKSVPGQFRQRRQGTAGRCWTPGGEALYNRL